MRIQARAKINWTLNVVGRRADGYHLLDGLMQPISLADEITMEKAEELTLTIQGAEALSVGEDNLILRAARALQTEAGVLFGAAISLQKNIPLGAGLGGGSADCAAALRGLNILWGLDFDLDHLCRIGVQLGADVPFCLHDAPRRAQGIGEILTPFSCKRTYPLVLLQNCEALSTKAVFAAYHAAAVVPPDTEGALRALENDDLPLLNRTAGNVLESASIPLRPEIARAKMDLTRCGAAFARMTGSGSVVFGVFETSEGAQRAWEELKRRYPVCILAETAL